MNKIKIRFNTLCPIGKQIFIGLLCMVLIISVTISGIFLFCIQSGKVQAEKECMSVLNLGVQKQYVEEKYGSPIIKFYDGVSATDISIYKQTNHIVWCAYTEDKMVAFVIFSKPESPIYDLKTHPGRRLTELTYADFSQTYDDVDANIPANNNDYLYLSEMIYGGKLTNYNYIIIGNYKDLSDIILLGELMRAHLLSAPRAEINFLRSKVKPNAYGMIMSGFEDKIGLIPPTEHLQTYNAILFSDW